MLDHSRTQQAQDAAAPRVRSRAGSRLVVVVLPNGARRIERSDGLPLGASVLPARPPGGLSFAERQAVLLREAEARRIREEVALRERLRREREQRAAGTATEAPPPVPRRTGRPDGWRQPDLGAFARRLGVDGEAVREARRRARISQRAIAGQLRVPRSVVADAETGRRSVCPAVARWAAQVLRASSAGPPGRL